jgi:hypothetical protein
VSSERISSIRRNSRIELEQTEDLEDHLQYTCTVRCSCELLRHSGIRLALIQRALVPPPGLVQPERRRRERKEQEQVVHRQRLGLKDRLHERHVYEPELRQE